MSESDFGSEAGSADRISVEHLCQVFDTDWRRGTQPVLENALGSVPQHSQRRLFRELLPIELRHRRRLRHAFDRKEYIDRFADFTAEIDLIFREDGPEKTQLAPRPKAEEVEDPRRIGRFIVERRLGVGGFGRVYLAYDPKLKRHVAVKVMHTGLARGEDVLREAQNAAGLTHEAIVTIYDVSTETDEPFIVQEFVSGEPLSDKLEAGHHYFIEEVVQLIVRIARGLGFAHRHRVFHRDLKPSNILIDSAGSPRLIDFGLALHESDRQHHRGEVAGSLSYMSPEQFRGESHRIDDRTDIWSLCVIFYRLLTGRLPFDGTSGGLVAEEVQFFDPTPPRQIDPAIPVALERIVLKGLEKRMADRYAVCGDLVEDLERAGAGTESVETQRQHSPGGLGMSDIAAEPATEVSEASNSTSREAIPVVPRGLLSFTAADADFYPTLLPGPFDRDGMPTSISFWLDRIANVDPSKAIPVGIIYGRSGCGKSSLIRAGVLPRLSRDTIPVYADCTDVGTERRIIEAVDVKCSDSAGDMDIMKRFVAIRESSRKKRNRKVLVILDQFEQWLHGRTDIAREQLTLALRQCDGVNLQVLLVVRDDFWLAVTQFLRAVEVPLAEDRNMMAVELFGKRHARHVLKRFGIAYGAFPPLAEEQTDEHDRFLDVAIEELSDGTHVPCVTLSLFAHMLKGQEWTGSALATLGGTGGVGVHYLERVFDGDSGPLLLRRYSKEAKQVLDLLLPQHGKDIKGHTRTRAELKKETGLDETGLSELLSLLDKELSLVAVSDADEDEPEARRCYRLAHDYMVAPIREWSSLSKRRTRRGRALLDLRESASRWNEQRIPGLLPSVTDYIRFQMLVGRSDRRSLEQEHLRAWGHRYYKRIAASVFLLGVGLLAASESRNRIGIRSAVRARTAELRRADSAEFDGIIAELKQLGSTADDELRQLETSDDPRLRNRSWLVRHDSKLGPLQGGLGARAADMIRDCDAVEGQRLLRILGQDSSASLRDLNNSMVSHETVDCTTVRYAAAMALLGDTRIARTLVGPGVNPRYRSNLTSFMSNWAVDWTTVLELVKGENNNSQLRSAAANAISLAWERLDPLTQTAALRSCQGLVNSCDEPVLVSSFSHILEQTGEYAPPAGSRSTSGKGWFVNSVGIRFLRIHRSKSVAHGHVYLSDREITNGLVRDFLRDELASQFERPPLVESEPSNLPARRISFYQAARFCNWLSEQEKLEPCYDEKTWACQAEKNGYRLPTFAEFDYAARGVAGKNYPWHCMDRADDDLLADYEVLAKKSGTGHQPGTRLPNSAGFYDTLGNIAEWTWRNNEPIVYSTYGTGVIGATSVHVRAGSTVEVKPNDIDSATLIGFRLAITTQ